MIYKSIVNILIGNENDHLLLIIYCEQIGRNYKWLSMVSKSIVIIQIGKADVDLWFNNL